jgi:hypothetical protein
VRRSFQTVSLEKLFGKWLGGLDGASLVAQRGKDRASLLRLTDSYGPSLGLSGFTKQFLEGSFPETRSAQPPLFT